MSADPDVWRSWSPDAQRRATDLIHAQKARPWRQFYCKNSGCDGRPHVLAENGKECPVDRYGHWWALINGVWTCTSLLDEEDTEFGCGITGTPVDAWVFPHARADQHPPQWRKRWRTWLVRSGRGGGKTETGSRLTHRVTDLVPRIVLIAATLPDFREIMVEGVSGLLATAKPGQKPEWEPSKKKLTWPNGCVAIGYSAEEPDRLRGPQSGFIWGDEWAHFDDPEKCWDNALFGMRLGRPSHVLITSTPKPTKWLKSIVADAKTIQTTVSTYANLYNLDPAYRELVIDKYEGTRKGRQELEGELLEDVEGALWASEMIVSTKVRPLHFDRIVVAVDPAGTAERRSDETGIVVLGWSDGIAYVLEDLSGKYTPKGWGDKAWSAHEKWAADSIVAEKNYGGEMVRHVLDTSSDNLAKVKLVNSRRGKQLRAEPIVAQYEKEKVLHAPFAKSPDALEKLEGEMLSWVPGEGASPNRVDALVHGLTELFRGFLPASVADPNEVLKHVRRNEGPGGIPGRGGYPWSA